MPAGTAIAQFLHWLPGLYWSKGNVPWPTRDGVIPARLFFLLYDELTTHVIALEELVVAMGAGAVLSGSDDGGGSLLQRTINLAYPSG